MHSIYRSNTYLNLIEQLSCGWYRILQMIRIITSRTTMLRRMGSAIEAYFRNYDGTLPTVSFSRCTIVCIRLTTSLWLSWADEYRSLCWWSSIRSLVTGYVKLYICLSPLTLLRQCLILWHSWFFQIPTFSVDWLIFIDAIRLPQAASAIASCILQVLVVIFVRS